MNHNLKKFITIFLILLALIAGVVFWIKKGKSPGEQTQLKPVAAITHGHGLAVDVADSNKLYIATHHGLLVLLNDKDLYQVGKKKDDYMGFSPHPTDFKVFFTSGHPSNGGNLGFQKSEDGGFSWKKIAEGVKGPVDFHAMTLSPANPNLVYGWYRGLQRSANGGHFWQLLETSLSDVISLVADPKDENVVFAATQKGLLVSKNKGEVLESVSDDLKDTAVISLAINPQDPQKLLSYSEKLQFAKSSDGGKTWEKVGEGFGGDMVLYLAYDKQKPEIVYALTRNNTLYKSTDSGDTWSKIR